jgi:hypothetical protein
MGKYSKGDTVRCVREYKMKNGDVAFKKARKYSIESITECEGGSEYILNSTLSKKHTMLESDLDEHFRVVEVVKSIFHKYYCGCYGIPVDSQNALIVKACDDDSGEWMMSMRDMTDKKSEPMTWEDQDELIRLMNNMLARGQGVTDFAFLINRIMEKE